MKLFQFIQHIGKFRVLVRTNDISDGAVTPEKLSADILKILATYKDLQNQIDSLSINGMAVSTHFGTDTHIGISQKTLTDAFVLLYAMIYNLQNVTMVENENGDIVLLLDDTLPQVDPFRPVPEGGDGGDGNTNNNGILDVLGEIRDFLRGYREGDVLHDLVVQTGDGTYPDDYPDVVPTASEPPVTEPAEPSEPSEPSGQEEPVQPEEPVGDTETTGSTEPRRSTRTVVLQEFPDITNRIS